VKTREQYVRSGRPLSDALTVEAARLRAWLLEAAFPMWWRVGADHSLGGFHERIDLAGRPVILPRRSRVAARQAFCYCEAGRLGWNGPWRDAAKHALDFLAERFVRDDSTIISSIGQDGVVVDATFDLYNQAFALFAYAYGHGVIDPAGGWQTRARLLLDTLRREFAHPDGGFREDREGRATLRANPHMHLLEAALAWITVDDAPAWRQLADEMAAMGLNRFIDGHGGALHEFFAADWTPVDGIPGKIVEPGHHYEWAYLLARWAALTRRERPAAVSRLVEFADAHGIDQARKVAVNGIWPDGRIHDPIARLWPQTERIRAYVVDRRGDDEARMIEAIETLWRYLDTPVPGLWHENLAADGRFVVEAAPATSLYHLVGAMTEVCTAFAPNLLDPSV
jgi:mannose/cellobiose epimerase-like protein (N-acyl-D-glucosamine 2-epimerase family)